MLLSLKLHVTCSTAIHNPQITVGTAVPRSVSLSGWMMFLVSQLTPLLLDVTMIQILVIAAILKMWRYPAQ